MWTYGPDAVDLALTEVAVPDVDADVDAVLHRVAGLLGRYEIARTTFDRRSVRQQVHPAVRLAVPVVAGEGDAGTAAERLTESLTEGLTEALTAEPFALPTEPPVRIGLVRRGRRVQAVSLVLSHLAFDAHAARLLREATVRAIAGRAPSQPPDQTSALVGRKASDRLRTRSDRALQHWRAAMDRLPAGAGSRIPTRGRYPAVRLRSVALAIAAQVVAVRTTTSSASVILAALLRALPEAAGIPIGALRLVAGNRHHADLAGFIGITAQNGLLVAPPAASDRAFDDLVRVTHRAALGAYSNARYDVRALNELVARRQELGTAPDLSLFFNDARTPRGWSGLERWSSSLRSRGEREPAEPAVLAERRIQDARLFLHILPGALDCSLLLVTDADLIGAQASAATLRRMREVVLAAALGEPRPG